MATLEWLRVGGSRSEAVHHHVFAIVGPLDLKANYAIRQGEQGVVPATTDVDAVTESGTALADDDAASADALSTKDLDAEPFGFRIAAVTGASACFFVCHVCFPLSRG